MDRPGDHEGRLHPPGDGIPDLDGVVQTGRSDSTVVGTPRETGDRILMRAEEIELFRGDVPDGDVATSDSESAPGEGAGVAVAGGVVDSNM